MSLRENQTKFGAKVYDTLQEKLQRGEILGPVRVSLFETAENRGKAVICVETLDTNGVCTNRGDFHVDKGGRVTHQYNKSFLNELLVR